MSFMTWRVNEDWDVEPHTIVVNNQEHKIDGMDETFLKALKNAKGAYFKHYMEGKGFGEILKELR